MRNWPRPGLPSDRTGQQTGLQCGTPAHAWRRAHRFDQYPAAGSDRPRRSCGGNDRNARRRTHGLQRRAETTGRSAPTAPPRQRRRRSTSDSVQRAPRWISDHADGASGATRMTSAGVVIPLATLLAPARRRVFMPSFMAQRRISSISVSGRTSSLMLSVIGMIS